MLLSACALKSRARNPFGALRSRNFAILWVGNLLSNIGSWMQTVAAQWLMLTLTGSAAYVALVQTAAGLPVVLFAILAGTIGDLVDRRRFLLITETFMLIAAAGLLGLAAAGTAWRRQAPARCRPRDLEAPPPLAPRRPRLPPAPAMPAGRDRGPRRT